MDLFSILNQYFRNERLVQDQAESRGVLNFSPKYVDSAGRLLFENLRFGGVATFVVPGRLEWNPESEYFAAARDAARRGCSITRLFLLPHRHFMRKQLLHHHWRLDRDAGIRLEFAIIGQDLGDITFLVSPNTLDFGLWDDEVVCYIYKARGGYGGQPEEWIVTRREEDIERAKRTWNSLRSLPRIEVTPEDILDEFALEEPLIQSAPLAAMLSEYLCQGDHMDSETCDWYHRVWQYLRILDLVSTPTWHSKFYLNWLCKDNFISKTRHVLISGTADYSLLAYVIQAFRQKNMPDIHVLDMCATPLHLCRWYAKRSKVEITTFQKNIFDLPTHLSYDLITADAFLTRFSEKERPGLLSHWNKLLAIGGRVVTTARIEESQEIRPGPIGSTNNQIADFTNRAFELAQLWREFVQIDPVQLQEWAQVYASKMISYSLKSQEDVQSVFLDAGFTIDYFELVTVKGEMKPTTYARIVATKTLDI